MLNKTIFGDEIYRYNPETPEADTEHDDRYDIFKRAFDKAEVCLEPMSNRYSDLNYSDIATKLIQEVGRRVDRYASDFLISWESFQEAIKRQPKREFMCLFATRESGVDHANFIYTTWENNSYPHYIDLYYSKIYAVVITPDTAKPDQNYVKVVLKEIKNELTSEFRELDRKLEFEKLASNSKEGKNHA